MNQVSPDDDGDPVQLPPVTTPDRTRAGVIWLLWVVAVIALLVAVLVVSLTIPRIPSYYYLPVGLVIVVGTPALRRWLRRRGHSAERDGSPR